MLCTEWVAAPRKTILLSLPTSGDYMLFNLCDITSHRGVTSQSCDTHFFIYTYMYIGSNFGFSVFDMYRRSWGLNHQPLCLISGPGLPPELQPPWHSGQSCVGRYGQRFNILIPIEISVFPAYKTLLWSYSLKLLRVRFLIFVPPSGRIVDSETCAA